MTALRTRKPTGAVPWPLILIEGSEKAGKSWACAEFTASDKIGQAYWLDLGEGAADEYAAIPGANYLVIEHDGTWRDIVEQVEAVRGEAQRAHDAGERPVVLVIDSMTAEWDLLKAWTQERANRSNAGKRALERDPDAEVKPPFNLWNDANARHGKLMHLLMTFPGIVLVTARGKEVAAMDSGGRPIANTKEYKVEGHKTLAFDATAWVRLSRGADPLVVGIRSTIEGVKVDPREEPKPWPAFSVEALVFEQMQCDPSRTRVRALQRTSTVDVPEGFGRAPEAIAAADAEGLARIAEWVGRPEYASLPQTVELLGLVAEREAVLSGATPPGPSHDEAVSAVASELGGTTTEDAA